jgi:hypothetical protein
MNANKTGHKSTHLKQGRTLGTLCITLAEWGQMPNFAFHFLFLWFIAVKLVFLVAFGFCSSLGYRLKICRAFL